MNIDHIAMSTYESRGNLVYVRTANDWSQMEFLERDNHHSKITFKTSPCLDSWYLPNSLVAFYFARGLKMIDLKWNSLNETSSILQSHSKQPRAWTLGNFQIPSHLNSGNLKCDLKCKSTTGSLNSNPMQNDFPVGNAFNRESVFHPPWYIYAASIANRSWRWAPLKWDFTVTHSWKLED